VLVDVLTAAVPIVEVASGAVLVAVSAAIALTVPKKIRTAIAVEAARERLLTNVCARRRIEMLSV
jgi:hypothetical protein